MKLGASFPQVYIPSGDVFICLPHQCLLESLPSGPRKDGRGFHPGLQFSRGFVMQDRGNNFDEWRSKWTTERSVICRPNDSALSTSQIASSKLPTGPFQGSGNNIGSIQWHSCPPAVPHLRLNLNEMMTMSGP